MAKEPVNQQKTIGCVFVVRTFLRANLSKTAGHIVGWLCKVDYIEEVYL